MRSPLMTHFEEFALSADLDGLARTVEAKSHWMERSFWVGWLWNGIWAPPQKKILCRFCQVSPTAK